MQKGTNKTVACHCQ